MTHAYFDNKQGTARFDADTAVVDSEIQKIQAEMGRKATYNEALREFTRRYSAFQPDTSDYEELDKSGYSVG